MTTPEARRELEVAKAEAADALDHAEAVQDRGVKIGERWRKSRADNNFRLMLRSIGKGAQQGA